MQQIISASAGAATTCERYEPPHKWQRLASNVGSVDLTPVTRASAMMISWDVADSSATAFKNWAAYDKAIQFRLASSALTPTAVDNRLPPAMCSNLSRFAPVRVTCLKGDCHTPSVMYTGAGEYKGRVCYGQAYGLVSNVNTTNAQCDWEMDFQNFRAVYLARSDSECQGSRFSGAVSEITRKSLWVQVHGQVDVASSRVLVPSSNVAGFPCVSTADDTSSWIRVELDRLYSVADVVLTGHNDHTHSTPWSISVGNTASSRDRLCATAVYVIGNVPVVTACVQPHPAGRYVTVSGSGRMLLCGFEVYPEQAYYSDLTKTDINHGLTFGTGTCDKWNVSDLTDGNPSFIVTFSFCTAVTVTWASLNFIVSTPAITAVSLQPSNKADSSGYSFSRTETSKTWIMHNENLNYISEQWIINGSLDLQTSDQPFDSIDLTVVRGGPCFNTDKDISFDLYGYTWALARNNALDRTLPTDDLMRTVCARHGAVPASDGSREVVLTWSWSRDEHDRVAAGLGFTPLERSEEFAAPSMSCYCGATPTCSAYHVDVSQYKQEGFSNEAANTNKPGIPVILCDRDVLGWVVRTPACPASALTPLEPTPTPTADTVEACKNACDRDPRCKSFSWSSTAGNCLYFVNVCGVGTAEKASSPAACSESCHHDYVDRAEDPAIGLAADSPPKPSWDDCAVTDFQVNPWWEVDLGEVTSVTSVKLRSSLASAATELSPFSVLVDNVECAADVGVVKGGDVRVPCRRAGRWVRVLLRRTARLSLCGFEVEAVSPTSSSHWIRLDLGSPHVVHEVNADFVYGKLVSILVGSGETHAHDTDCKRSIVSWEGITTIRCIAPKVGRFVTLTSPKPLSICDLQIWGTAAPSQPLSFFLGSTCGEWNKVPSSFLSTLVNPKSEWGFWLASSLSLDSHVGYSYLWQMDRATLVRDPIEHVWSWRVEGSEIAYSKSLHLVTSQFVPKRCGTWTNMAGVNLKDSIGASVLLGYDPYPGALDSEAQCRELCETEANCTGYSWHNGIRGIRGS